MHTTEKVLIGLLVATVALSAFCFYKAFTVTAPRAECLGTTPTTTRQPAKTQPMWVFHDIRSGVIVTSDDVYTILKPSPMETLQ